MRPGEWVYLRGIRGKRAALIVSGPRRVPETAVNAIPGEEDEVVRVRQFLRPTACYPTRLGATKTASAFELDGAVPADRVRGIEFQLTGNDPPTGPSRTIRAALEHRDADWKFGREWCCPCAACRAVRSGREREPVRVRRRRILGGGA